MGAWQLLIGGQQQVVDAQSHPAAATVVGALFVPANQMIAALIVPQYWCLPLSGVTR
jgi:hypothetical protein